MDNKSVESAPLVSVVIPTYNRAALLKCAIESVESQTYKKLEIIVVDDGSEDETKATCESFPRVKYFYQDNAGASAARNNGIKRANGEYIAFLDSDDVWHPEKTEKQIEFFRQYPEVGLVSCNASWSKGDEISFNVDRRKYKGPVVEMPELVNYPYLGTPSVVIKSEVFDQAGYFDTDLKTAEDLDFFIRVAEHYSVGYLFESLVCIRKTIGSLSDNESSFEDNLKIYDKFFERNPEFLAKYPEIKREVYYRIYINYAEFQLCRRELKSARKQLIGAIKHKPTRIAFWLYFKSLILSVFMLSPFKKYVL